VYQLSSLTSDVTIAAHACTRPVGRVSAPVYTSQSSGLLIAPRHIPTVGTRLRRRRGRPGLARPIY